MPILLEPVNVQAICRTFFLVPVVMMSFNMNMIPILLEPVNLHAIWRTCFRVNTKMIPILLKPVNAQAMCRTCCRVQHEDDANCIGTSQCTINLSNMCPC